MFVRGVIDVGETSLFQAMPFPGQLVPGCVRKPVRYGLSVPESKPASSGLHGSCLKSLPSLLSLVDYDLDMNEINPFLPMLPSLSILSQGQKGTKQTPPLLQPRSHSSTHTLIGAEAL